jgi:hypothetical protein
MNERRTTTLVLAPLLALAALAGHALAYMVAEPDSSTRASLLARTGHGYLAWAPTVAGFAALALVVALAVRVLAAVRGVTNSRVHPIAVLVPVVGFVVQETLERRLAGLGAGALVTERPFVLGLVLDLAFGVLAVAAGRLLLRGADSVGRYVSDIDPPRAPAPAVVGAAVVEDLPAPKYQPYLAVGRAPPAAVSC